LKSIANQGVLIAKQLTSTDQLPKEFVNHNKNIAQQSDLAIRNNNLRMINLENRIAQKKGTAKADVDSIMSGNKHKVDLVSYRDTGDKILQLKKQELATLESKKYKLEQEIKDIEKGEIRGAQWELTGLRRELTELNDKISKTNGYIHDL